MPRKRNIENEGLPQRWQFKNGSYHYRVPEDERHSWGGKQTFRLGKTLEEARSSFESKGQQLHPDFKFYKKIKPQRPSLYDEACGIPYSVLKAMLTSARSGASQRNISFDLSIYQLVILANKAAGKCMFSGIPWDYSTQSKKTNKAIWKPSLDRIDASKGYEEGNVRLICIAANLALMDFGDDVFARLATAFVNKNS
ncbi:MAG: hypothetical protein ACOVKL_04870 [Polynucleobacter sp.]